jgi:signal transduction histidine kinase
LFWQHFQATYFLPPESLAVSLTEPGMPVCKIIFFEPLHRVMTSPLVFAFHGILIFQLLCTLFFFFSTRRREYLFYLCYLLAAISYFVYQFHLTDTTPSAIIPRLLFNELYQWLAMLIYTAYSWFLDAFLNTALHFRRTYLLARWLRLLFAAYFLIDLGCIILLRHPLNPTIYWGCSLALGILLLMVCADIYSKRTVVNRLILVGVVLVVLSSIISTFFIVRQQWYGIAPPAHPLLISYSGVLLETICFSAALLLKSLQAEKQQLQTEKEMLVQMQEMRYKISADLHDQVGSTLYSVSLYSQMARSSLATADKATVDEILGRIEHSSRSMLTEMNDIVWALNPINDSREKLAERITSFVQGICLPAGITPHITINWQQELQCLTMQQRKNLFLVMKEAVTNSVKYSGTAELYIHGSETAARMQVAIKDGGCGFDPDCAANGNGLRNMQRRLEEIGGSMILTTGRGSGTEISICIPLS